MGVLENILIVDFYLCAFIACGFIGAAILWVSDKIGFTKWARGWLWYFGIVEDCPDIEQQ